LIDPTAVFNPGRNIRSLRGDVVLSGRGILEIEQAERRRNVSGARTFMLGRLRLLVN
jgi:hypothetical protein